MSAEEGEPQVALEPLERPLGRKLFLKFFTTGAAEWLFSLHLSHGKHERFSTILACDDLLTMGVDNPGRGGL